MELKMELNSILLANIINLIGVLLLLASHTMIGLSDKKKGFVLSFFGGVFVSLGSYILNSYPIVLLNIIWIMISIYGYFNVGKKSNILYCRKVFILFSFLTIGIFGIYLQTKNIDLLAYYTTFIYISVYFLFASGRVGKESYLFWCLIGFFLVLPHLFDKMQYAIFLNEGYGAIISILGLLKSYKKKDNKKVS